ncbi:hypothetical protein BJY04DRAFT_221643 [Aspergillus karnatakaensis]|uniref:uncharacterized protein n=1 Tax=Aspergillus karnatakaensis TaxID=1810916 RepID=UPI003CCCE093
MAHYVRHLSLMDGASMEGAVVQDLSVILSHLTGLRTIWLVLDWMDMVERRSFMASFWEALCDNPPSTLETFWVVPAVVFPVTQDNAAKSKRVMSNTTTFCNADEIDDMSQIPNGVLQTLKHAPRLERVLLHEVGIAGTPGLSLFHTFETCLFHPQAPLREVFINSCTISAHDLGTLRVFKRTLEKLHLNDLIITQGRWENLFSAILCLDRLAYMSLSGKYDPQHPEASVLEIQYVKNSLNADRLVCSGYLDKTDIRGFHQSCAHVYGNMVELGVVDFEKARWREIPDNFEIAFGAPYTRCTAIPIVIDD